MSFTRTRTMRTSLTGPTVDELRSLLEGIEGGQRVHITYDKGYGQLDPGQITFTVEEK